MRQPVRAALIGALFAALTTLPGLGTGTLWDNSETAYGEVAREILLQHDWVVMHLNGSAWFVQPPLYFWIAALLALTFSVGTFALRLPSALATIGMGAATGYAGTVQAGVRTGVYAALVLSTCLMQAVVGRMAIMDALLDLFVTLAIFWWFRALQSGKDRYFVLGWIACAAGFLAKGPVAPVIALLVVAGYALWERRDGDVRVPSIRGWLAGLALFVAIVAPWMALLYARVGAHAFVEMIGHYTFGRYTGTIENQSGPVWYYLPVVVIGFFPWIAFLPSSIAYGIDRLRNAPSYGAGRGAAQLLRLVFAWIVLPLVFFSFAKTKLPNYIALEFPALALLVALYFDAVVQKGRSRSVLISTACVPVAIGLIAVAIFIFSRDNRLTGDLASAIHPFLAVGAAIFFGSIVTFALLLRARTIEMAPYALGASMTLGVIFLAVLVLPQAERFKPVPQLAAVIDAQRRPGDVVAIQNVSGGNALLFYTRPRVYALASPGEHRPDSGIDPRSIICGAKRAWVIAPKIRPGYDPTYGRSRRIVATAAKAVLFLYDGPPCT
jgi:4-amino-4-deoxy-L-arabinose transferase-like glycosyltransferase